MHCMPFVMIVQSIVATIFFFEGGYIKPFFFVSDVLSCFLNVFLLFVCLLINFFALPRPVAFSESLGIVKSKRLCQNGVLGQAMEKKKKKKIRRLFCR